MSIYWRAPLKREPRREKPWSEVVEFREEWKRNLAARHTALAKTSALERLARRLQWLETTKAMQAATLNERCGAVPSSGAARHLLPVEDTGRREDTERGGVPACSPSAAPAQEGKEQ